MEEIISKKWELRGESSQVLARQLFETARYETAFYEATRYETAFYETARYETSHYETAFNETAHHETAHNETRALNDTELSEIAYYLIFQQDA